MKKRWNHKQALLGFAIATLLTVPTSVSFAQTGPVCTTSGYCDSNVVMIKTNNTAVAVTKGSYTLYCVPISISSISVSWSGNVTDPHTVELFGFDKTKDFDNHDFSAISHSNQIFPTPVTNTFSGPGSFIETGLNANQTRYYSLETIFSDPSLQPAHTSPAISCTTFSPAAVNAPSDLSIFAIGADKLALNWKDNSLSTDVYTFEIQRLKVTPDRTSSITLTASGPNKIHIDWENSTVSTPFYTSIERSSLDHHDAFGSSDNTIRTFNYIDQDDPIKNPMTSFSYDDTSGLNAHTEYSYRVRICSLIPVGDFYTKPANPDAYLNAKATSTCSGYSDIAWKKTLTASLGQKIIGYAKNLLQNIFGGSRVNVAEGQTSIDYNDYFNTAATMIKSINPYYVDFPLVPATAYLYRVRTKDTTTGNVSGWSGIAGGKTLTDATGITSPAYLCTANSFCDKSIYGFQSSVQAADGSIEIPEYQCKVNADCKNVGRSSKTSTEQ